jgi:hypothetical protein
MLVGCTLFPGRVARYGYIRPGMGCTRDGFGEDVKLYGETACEDLP